MVEQPMAVAPHALVRLALKSTLNGGRELPIARPPLRYDHPVIFDDQQKDANKIHAYSCAFVIDETTSPIEPGGPPVILPVVFHTPELVAQYLRVGNGFIVYEGKDVGHAEILEVFPIG
jgi:hypothetical protein